MISPEQAEEALAAWRPAPAIIAIDGLPLAGKSTLAERLAARFGWAVLGLDDFCLPPESWPADIAPAFPFPFFRLDEFRDAVRSLRATGRCSWRPIAWPTLTVSPTPAHLDLSRPVIVEGCSVLEPALTALYDVRIFVESVRASLAAAQKARDGENVLAADWERLFLPSVDLYMQTEPQQRADVLVAGRDR